MLEGKCIAINERMSKAKNQLSESLFQEARNSSILIPEKKEILSTKNK